jgi:CheY-like chemotaxis protein
MRVDALKVSGSPTAGDVANVIPTRSAAPIERSRAQVLVAACDASVRDVRERQLTASGLHVRLARTGFEAIVKATCYLPNLILLDASLGSEEVQETSRMLATCPVTAHIPIVCLSPRRRVPRRMLQGLASAAV